MAVPTITSITPAVGPTGGHNLVIIAGTNFHVPTPPLPAGPIAQVLDGVDVLFGSEPALRVEVVSSALLYVLAPAIHGQVYEDPIPATSVTVTNIDANGEAVAGETVTANAAYSYRRPVIHSTSAAPTAKPSPFALVSASLTLMLRRQVITNVVQTTHVDYAEPGILSIAIGKVPGIIVQGPIISKDMERTHNEPLEIDLNTGFIGIKQAPFVCKMGYTFIGVTDSDQESMNLQGSLVECFTKGKYLSVQVDPLDPSQGRAELVLQMTQYPQATNAPSDSNIRTWTANAEVRGIEIYFDDVVEQMPTETEVNLEVQQLLGLASELIVV